MPRSVADRPVVGPVAFLGLGLIGGSIARDLRATSPATRIVAWSPEGGGPRAALAEGVIDASADTVAAAVEGAAIVVLAGPPLAITELLHAEADTLRVAASAGATITDVASTKTSIVAAADRAALPFVGGHPLAGRETSGFGAAETGLFRDRPWVVVKGAAARDADIERVEDLARLAGARPMRLSAHEHDTAVAAISHLPLVVAAALVEAATASDDWPAARVLAASGWTGMTRLARGDPEMGAGILATNRAATAERLRAFRVAIDDWLAALSDGAPDRAAGPDALRGRLAAARAALEDAPDD